MYRVVVTDIHVITRLYRIGLLKYFNNQEIAFYITEFCYSDIDIVYANDMRLSQQLIDQGILTLVKFPGEDVLEINKHFQPIQNKFAFKTVSALVFAKRMNYHLLSNCETLSDHARIQMGIKVIEKEKLATNLISDIGSTDINLDSDLINEMLK